MYRILILIILVWVACVLAKRFFNSLKNDTSAQSKNDVSQTMVKCALCATHIPEHEAMLLKGQQVCKQQPCNT